MIHDKLNVGKITALRLNFPGPLALIVKHQSNLRARWRGLRAKRGKFSGNLARFVKGFIGFAVWQQQRFVHLLLGKRRLPPAEIGNDLRTRCKSFMRPETRRSSGRRGVPRRPVHRTGLLFHYPPAAPAAGAVEIMVESRKIWVADTQIPGFCLVIDAAHLEESKRI